MGNDTPANEEATQEAGEAVTEEVVATEEEEGTEEEEDPVTVADIAGADSEQLAGAYGMEELKAINEALGLDAKNSNSKAAFAKRMIQAAIEKSAG